MKAVVSGTSSGIGLAIAECFLERGIEVIGISRRKSEALEGRQGFEQVRLDLGALDPLPAELQKLSRRHPDVGVLVLNAGRGEFGSLEEFSYARIRELLDLGFLSHAYLARAFLPLMKRQGSGQLIFVGSEAAHRGTQKGSLYCAAKFALRGFAQALREETSGSGVRVTLISPAMTRTPFFDDLDFAPGEDPENYLEPTDVAAAVLLAVEGRAEAVVDEIRLSPLKRVVRRRKRS